MRPGKEQDTQDQHGYSRTLPRPPKSQRNVKLRQQTHPLDRYSNLSDATTGRLSFPSADDLDRYGTVRSPTEMARFTEFRKKPNMDRYFSFSTVQTARDKSRKREAPKLGTNRWKHNARPVGARVLPDVPGEPTGARNPPNLQTIIKDVKCDQATKERTSIAGNKTDDVLLSRRLQHSTAASGLPQEKKDSAFSMPAATFPPPAEGTIPGYLLPPLGGMFPARSRGDPSRCSSSEEVSPSVHSRREMAVLPEKGSLVLPLQDTVPSSPGKEQHPAEHQLRRPFVHPAPPPSRTAFAVGPVSPPCSVEKTPACFTSDHNTSPLSPQQTIPGPPLAVDRSFRPFLPPPVTAYGTPRFREKIYTLLVDGCRACRPCSPETNRARIRYPVPNQHQYAQLLARAKAPQFYRPRQPPPANKVNRCVPPHHSAIPNQAHFRSRKTGSFYSQPTQTDPEMPSVRTAEPESSPLSKETQVSSHTERQENVPATERDTERSVNVVGSEAPPLKDEKAAFPLSTAQQDTSPGSTNEVERTVQPSTLGAARTPTITSSTTLFSSETSTESSTEESDSVSLETDSTSTSTPKPIIADPPPQSASPSPPSNAGTDTKESSVLPRKQKVSSPDMKLRKNPTARRYGRSTPKESLVAKSDFRSERDMTCRAVSINVPRSISLKDVATSTCLSPPPRPFITTPELDLPPSPMPSPSPPIARHPFFSPPTPIPPTRPKVPRPEELYIYQPPSPPLVEEMFHVKPQPTECELKQQFPVSEGGVAMHLCVAINLVLFSALLGIVIAYFLGSDSFRRARGP